MSSSSDPRPSIIRSPSTAPVVAILVLLTLLSYWRVGQNGFVNLDDDAYVEYQPLVNRGFTSAGVAWALTGTHSNNWHPLTTLSHMLDCEVFGVRAASMHWVNLGWHALNSILVFFVWRALTGATWRPAVLAALFAVHPLHVESVAWIAERKDVLSGFFWLVGLWAYLAYARQRSTGRYLAVAGAMVLALLAKPMAVTLPCTLLLVDYWQRADRPWKEWRALLVEKLPLFGLVAVHSVVTFLVQRATGAAEYGRRIPLDDRLANAVVSYLRYLGKTVWPETLAPMYFHPGQWASWIVVAALLTLVSISVAAARNWRTRPWLGFGWLWFLGTLVPVIGLVQVGSQSMADRYMYMPILGVLTAVVWAAHGVLARWPRLRPALIAATVGLIGVLGLLTMRQTAVWKGSVALYRHCLAVGEDNAAVRYLFATALHAAGRPVDEVVAQFREALQRDPTYINAMTQLAVIALAQGRKEEARALVENTVRLEPLNPGVHTNLGAYWMRMGALDEARRHYERALQLNPKLPNVYLDLGRIDFAQNRAEEGAAHFRARARLARWDAEAQADCGIVLVELRRPTEAIPYLERALWITPGLERARQALETARQRPGSPG